MSLKIRIDADRIKSGSELTFRYTGQGGDNVFPLGANITGDLIWKSRPQSDAEVLSPSLDGGILVVDGERWNIEPRGPFQLKDHAGNEENMRIWVVVGAAKSPSADGR